MKPPTIARLVLCALLVASAARVATQGSISITTFDRSSAPTFALVTINGAGFDTGNAISVIFSGRDVITATVPAVTASASAVRVAVPPLINSASGNLFDTPVVVDVQVVQISSSSVMTSNTLGGLTIEPTPQLNDLPGTFTRAFLRTVIDVQSDLRNARQSTPGFADVLASSQALGDSQRALLDAVEQILKSPDAVINLPTKDDLPVPVSAKTLRGMDRVGSAFVQQSNGIYKVSSGGPVTTTPCTCNPISDLDRSLCEFRQNPCAAYDPSRKVVPEGAVAVYGAAYSVLGSWTAGSLSSASFVASETASGMSLILTEVLVYATSVMAGIEPPGSSTLIRDTGTSLLDDLNNNGVGVFSGLKTATTMTQQVEHVVNSSRGPLPTAPRGGLITCSPTPSNPPANTRPTRIYSGTSGVGPKWIATPVNQTVTTLTTATLPPPLVARFNGAYTGASAGSCTVQTPEGPISASGGQGISASVGNGVVTVEGLVGSVTETGRFTAPSVAAGGISCTVGGLFWVDTSGRTGASGFFRCGGDGVSCAGTWNLQR